MNLCSLIKSLLVYLLLCYGKKFVNSNPGQDFDARAYGQSLPTASGSSDGDTSRVDDAPSRSLAGGDGDVPEVLLVNNKKSNNAVEYSKISGKVGAFTPKHNIIFKVIKCKGVEVWHPDKEKECSDKVFVDNKTTNIIARLKNGRYKHFALVESKWKEVEPSVMVDLNVEKHVLEYEFLRDDKTDTRIYTPRGDFLIKGVREEKLYIWSSRKRSEYADKMVLKGSGGSQKIIVLSLIDGNFVVLYQSGKKRPWVNETKNIKAVEDLKKYGIDPDHFGLERVKQKLDSSQVKGRQRSPNGSPEKKLFARYFPGGYKLVKIPMILDLSISKATPVFDFVKVEEADLRIFIPKHNFYVNEIRKTSGSCCNKSLNEIWDARNDEEYAYKVVLKGKDGGEKYLGVFYVSGQIKLLYKPNKNSRWVDKEADRSSISILRMEESDSFDETVE